MLVQNSYEAISFMHSIYLQYFYLRVCIIAYNNQCRRYLTDFWHWRRIKQHMQGTSLLKAHEKQNVTHIKVDLPCERMINHCSSVIIPTPFFNIFTTYKTLFQKFIYLQKAIFCLNCLHFTAECSFGQISISKHIT